MLQMPESFAKEQMSQRKPNKDYIEYIDNFIEAFKNSC